MQEFILTTPEKLKTLVYDAIKRVANEKSDAENKLIILNLKEVKDILKVGDIKLKNLISSGSLKTTPHKKVTRFEINRFLENEK